MRRAMLALEDGLVFEGEAFAADGERCGEAVFNTSMAGYQEILTDPSYKGQIVTMTYPLIGNYGVNEEDLESLGPHVEGFAVREYCPVPSNWRSRRSLGEFLTSHGIIGIEGLDTRALTKHLRTYGAKKAVLSTVDFDAASLVEKARRDPGLIGVDLVREVTRPDAREWTETGFGDGPTVDERQLPLGLEVPPPLPRALGPAGRRQPWEPYRVVVMDFGVKHNILRKLYGRGCRVLVVPAQTTAEEITAWDPDGLVLSNGPGDPEGVPYVIETVRKLIGRLPIFGICLGHQILGLAFGGRTYKLKFGHRGANHPVRNELTGQVEITAQNHGFAVDMDSLAHEPIEMTHVNLNDNTNEGMRHRVLPIFSVQYHPEASPGPHDADYLFDQFTENLQQATTHA